MAGSPVAAARAVLTAAGFPEYTAGRPPTAGFTVTPLAVIGLPRAAVAWLEPGAGPARGYPSRPGPELARCQQALTLAGCLCAFVIASDGGRFLAVIPPAGC